MFLLSMSAIEHAPPNHEPSLPTTSPTSKSSSFLDESGPDGLVEFGLGV